ncbi:HWE histidine kinase domain-containing protein [Pararhizobium mangrovi]|uniref:histidine kinase n=1 Tax=Pararhizobium mangrovi TaxID=2590452 RepID=A0A506UD38_9HYPH|nr:HWE histidine kinase domain-containing protein [Pararhizobium mangrovi]TPW30705.1 GAF domain-containing protein [Pararhizobium mangrovi]
MTYVTLENCDREPIHLLGRVQSFGFLIGFDQEWRVSHISENARTFLPSLDESALGQEARVLLTPEIVHTIRNRLQYQRPDSGPEVIGDLALPGATQRFDAAVHRSGDTVVLECEPAMDPFSETELSAVRNAAARFANATGMKRLMNDAVRLVRMTTGHDRVMFYRFLPDDSGEVVAEARGTDLEAFLGLRYPASDIPSQARRLYAKNPIRIIADVHDEGATIEAASNVADPVVDLSSSVIRSVSPIHLEYLRNMGVTASMSISIVIDGKLWGLIACHHYSGPYMPPLSRRNASVLLGQMLSLALQRRLSKDEQIHDEAVRRVSNEISRAVTNHVPTREALYSCGEEFEQILRADGFAFLYEGVVTRHGSTPSSDNVSALAKAVNTGSDNDIVATSEIGTLFGSIDWTKESTAGAVIIPISRTPRDYLIFFRDEVRQQVVWGGNPDKPIEYGPNGARLSPRKSFEAWQTTVAGKSEDWLPADLRAASHLRITLLEVVLRLAEEAALERRRAAETQELLIAELNHRVRNILGLVRGLVSQSRDPSLTIEQFAAIIDSRLHALARAHNQITKTNWSNSSLSGLIAAEAESYLLDRRSWLTVGGDDVLLTPTAYSTVALVMHEMVTNAAKYGALTDERGRAKVMLTLKDGGVAIDWTESGGPPVKAPTRRGFGSTIIERSVPFELQGEADIRYDLEGVSARFWIPNRHFTVAEKTAAGKTENPASPDEAGASPATHAVPQRVLIAEDNMLIAMEAEDMVRDLGATEVVIVPSVAGAMQEIEQREFDFALLDVNLGDETSFVIAETLMSRGVRIGFASGYGDDARTPATLVDVPRISKPYSNDAIRELLLGK